MGDSDLQMSSTVVPRRSAADRTNTPTALKSGALGRFSPECPRRVDELVVTLGLPWQGEADSGVLDRTGYDRVHDSHA